jgi:hypothetical protein
MLKVCRKGDVEGGQTLSADEDRALRLAFGRFAAPEARSAGAAVVQRYQHLGFGNWFHCDCRDSQERPPVLVPVLESFIRRHTDPAWPPHADGCDFQRDPAEQRAITRSYARPASGPLRLLRGFSNDEEDYEPSAPMQRCYSRRREALATLLMQLVEQAGLNRIPAEGGGGPDLGEQYRRLRAAAHAFELAKALPVAAYLCTYPPALPEFLDRITSAPAARFKRTRPHGIFLTIATGVGHGELVLGQANSLPVRGRISVFGERDGHGRDRPADRAARAPYLAICLVGRPSAGEPVTILRAYAHPCVSARNLMLVDSNLERRTLDELRRLQDWLSANKGLRLGIEKPHFDIAGEDDAMDSEAPPREPCIPDFILRAEGVGTQGAETALVETMGFGDETYRARKQVVHDLMRQVMDAPVVLHDFHFPADCTQTARDRRFWRDARWTVTSPEVAVSLRAPGQEQV